MTKPTREYWINQVYKLHLKGATIKEIKKKYKFSDTNIIEMINIKEKAHKIFDYKTAGAMFIDGE